MADAAGPEDWPRTVEEFEAWHARQPERWEFIRGEPRLMAPASMKHSIIKRNVAFALQAALAPRGCEALVDGAADPDRRDLGDPGRGGHLQPARPDRRR